MRGIVAVSAVTAAVAIAAITAGASLGVSDSQQQTPQTRLIVVGHSVGGIRLDESQASVEREFGAGSSRQRGLVTYFGGRLSVNYWFHGALTKRVQTLQTRWSGFHTRSGVHVGSNRAQVRALHFACSNGTCSRAAGPMPDAPGTVFTMRHGKVAKVDIFYA